MKRAWAIFLLWTGAAFAQSEAVQWASSPLVYASCCDFPASLDPAIASDQPSTQISRLAYEPLVDYVGGSSELAPLLAESWSVSEDGLVYTFNLRQGVHFHDGTIFDAEAVKFTVDRIKTLNLGVAAFLTSLSHTEVVDQYKVRLVLSGPDANFQWALPSIRIVSPAAAKANELDGDLGREFLRENMVGTGPYRLAQYDPPNIIQVTAFEDYWRGWEGPHFREAIWRFGMDYATRLLNLEQGQIDLTESIGYSDVGRLSANPLIDVEVSPLGRCACFFLNTASGPLSDVNVRRALQLSFPYETVTTQLFPDSTYPMRGGVPEGLSDIDLSGFSPWQQDLKRARAILDEAGYAGKPITLTLGHIPGMEIAELPAQVWQADLASIGITLQLQPVPWGTLVETMSQPETAFDIGIVFIGNVSPYVGEYFKRWAHSRLAAYKWTHYSNPELDAMIERAALTTDATERQRILIAVHDTLVDQAVMVFGFGEQQIMAHRSDLGGFEVPTWRYLLATDLYDLYRAE